MGRFNRLFAPVDVAPLVYARIAFGAIMLVEIVRFFRNGWIERYYIEPTFTFTYPGFGWVQPLPAAGMYVTFGALGVFAAMIALGLFYRVAATLFALGFTYVFLLDQTNYLNHVYLICLFAGLLAVVPAASAGSLDARRHKQSVQTVAAWCRWLLVGQIAVVYFFGGLAKLDSDWLSGAPAGMFLDNWELTEPLADSELGRRAFALGGLVFDLCIVPALLWGRTRWLATAAAVVFHLFNFKLFNIGIFPWLMLALIPLFWPPACSRRALAFFRVLPPEAPAAREDLPAVSVQLRIVAALACYAAIQLLVPLRHWLYPGEVNWTEEGHHFSWHMKLRVKSGETTFVASGPGRGEVVIAPDSILTPRQAKKLATHPEMIRQFAHELARRMRAEGWADVTIRANAAARLNGRQMQVLIDPEVDLSRTGWSWSAGWIVPFKPTPVVHSNDEEDE